ncbi:MAG TPA: DNA polymerase I, partial [Gammaproteobacteria bacterium]|nr:DNA polymerase I [Gammaproteobacteria bacterium]
MTEKTAAPLILVDGSSYLYRAFHALPSLTTSDGRPTGAVRGVIAMLKKMQSDYQPSQMVVIFDAKGKTFRDDMFPEYKSQRPPMPDDLRAQIEPLYALVEALGLPMIIEPGVEADDVIGTLADQASKQGIDVLVSTGDKDMAQLVNEHVTLINTMTNVVMGVEGVIEKFGVPPERIVDYLALIGDKVDNVPGVDKVGPKTAVKWLTLYGDLEGIMENADKIKGKVGENLRAALAFLPLGQALVTIKRDVPLKVTLEDLQVDSPDTEKLAVMYQDLEFKRWLSELGVDAGAEASESPQGDYEAILDEAQLSHWLQKLEQAELFALDTETTSLNYMDAEVVGFSFAVDAGTAA